MNKIMSVVLAIIILVLGLNGCGKDPLANEILEKVVSTYKAMRTYKAEGTITNESQTNVRKDKSESTFTILLKKPNMYLITWTSVSAPAGHGDYSSAVWSDGTQPYLYFGMVNTYGKMPSDEIALKAARLIYIPALNIPPLFLSDFKGEKASFSWLKDPKIERIEKVGDEDCYVIIGSSEFSKTETFWISKTSYHIRKYSQSFKPPEAETQVYTEISSPELNKDDFKYALPEKAYFRENWRIGMD